MTHIKSVHIINIPSTQCERKFKQKEFLMTHNRSVHEGNKFPCSQCEQKFSQKGHLKTHIKPVHEGI